MARVCIVGIGNTLMGDDGVGVRITDELATRDLGPCVKVVSAGVAGVAAARHFIDSDSVVVVDAISADDVPGSVFRFTPEEAGISQLRSHTSHGLSLPAVLFAASLKGALPHVIIYAVQIGDITCGFETLTPDVEAAVPDVCDMVAAEAVRLVAESPAQREEPNERSHSATYSRSTSGSTSIDPDSDLAAEEYVFQNRT